jgi:hypothetical protein
VTLLDIRLAVRGLLGPAWEENWHAGETYEDLARRPALAEHRDALLLAHEHWLAEAAIARPTEFGVARYPETGGYYEHQVVDGGRYACVCWSGCAKPCRGECICPACTYAFRDWEEFGADTAP